HPDATICFLSRCDRPPRSPLFPYTTLFRSLRAAQPGTVTAVAVLLIAQALLQMSFSAFQPLVALRLLVHAGSDVNTITGITFGAIGLASAVAAVVYSGAARRYGYLTVSISTAVLMGLAEVTCGIVPSAATIVFAGAV